MWQSNRKLKTSLHDRHQKISGPSQPLIVWWPLGKSVFIVPTVTNHSECGRPACVGYYEKLTLLLLTFLSKIQPFEWGSLWHVYNDVICYAAGQVVRGSEVWFWVDMWEIGPCRNNSSNKSGKHMPAPVCFCESWRSLWLKVIITEVLASRGRGGQPSPGTISLLSLSSWIE